MATPVKMERLSKFTAQSEVLEWLKAPGERVQKGEPLLTVHSDKASVELVAPANGVLLRVLVPAGEQVPAGALLAWIGEPGEVIERAALGQDLRQDFSDRSVPSPRVRVKAVPAARRLAREQGVALESLEGTGPGGIITRGDVARAARVPTLRAARVPTLRAARASPVARRLAQEWELDLEKVEGTGPDGKVLKADVERFLATREPEALADKEQMEEAEQRLLPLNNLQRVMAQRMAASHQTIVQATTVADVDMSAIVRLREHIPASFTAFVIKAAARAVADFPTVNATLESGGAALCLNPHVHMGVAVSTDEGLLVPVVRHAETKSLAQIHREIKGLAGRARQGALRPEDLDSPTMTVTNSGAFGSLLFTPLIVAPQSVTLGMGKVAPTPVVRKGEIVAREIMYLCLSYDHRFLEGAVAVRYLQRVRALLEEGVPLLWDEEDLF